MGKFSSKITAAIIRAFTDRAGEMFRRHVLDEALKPLRRLGRKLAFGVAGAMLIAIGVVAALVGVLRVLQTETGTAFAGSWSFAPYLLTAAAGIVALGGFAAFGFRGVVGRSSGRGARRRS